VGARCTSYWELRTTGNELQEVPPLLVRELAHRLEQIPHALAVEIVAVIRLDGVHES
jgi:hypothetical protein